MKSWMWLGLVFASCVGLTACGGANGASARPDGGTGTPPGSGSGDGGTKGSGVDGSAPLLGDGGKPPVTGLDGSVPTSADGGAVTGITAVTIIVEPNGNSASELVAAINAATKSVHMTMYLLDDANIINALVARVKAGIDVKVILNNFVDQTSSGDNTTVYNKLKASGVPVVLSDPTRFTFTHEKCVIIDHEAATPSAWIMTMNAETSSPQVNREYLAIDTVAADVTEVEQIFEADYADTAITASGTLVVAPDPPNDARHALVALIDSATKTLDLELEEFSDTYSTGVVNAVAAAAKRGVKVRVILANSTPTANQTSSIATAKAAGASVVVSGGTSGSSSASKPYIHAKAITVDCTSTTCARGWVGSENMTGGSLGYNREIGVVIANGAELFKIETAMNGDFAAGTAQ